MRWTWPSWLSIFLGAVALVSGFVLGMASPLAPSLLIVGGILLAAGLHALQGAWSSCCGACGDYGCDCQHCEGCREGDCCGECACYGPEGRNGESPGHEGHGHDGGHSH